MSRFNLRWSVIAVAILVLLAFYRSRTVNQIELDTNRQPAIHEILEPGFAAIPEPAFVDSSASNQQSIDTRQTQENEIRRFEMATDGGDFKPTPGRSAATLELATDEPDEMLIDQNALATQSSPKDDRSLNSSPLSDSSNSYSVTKAKPITINPVLVSLEQGEELATDSEVDVQSVPDFEPAFARAQPPGRVNLPRGVLVKVVNHIEYGKSLARRGAVFGAKQEFLAALKLVAQSVDQVRGGNSHSAAFFAAIQAMRESDDFYRAQGEHLRQVDVVAIAKRHQSKVIDPEYLRGLNPMQAMQTYYDFVQERLVACSGHTVVAGESLYCLGKLHQVKSKDPIEGSAIDNAKSVVFYNASVNCDPKAYKAANELGVLLARSGRLVEAKNLFLQSLKTRQISKVWANLASVHRQLGENQLAQLADDEYQRMLEGPAANRIIWVEPEQFAKSHKDPLPLRTADAQGSQDKREASKKSTGGLRNIMKKLF